MKFRKSFHYECKISRFIFIEDMTEERTNERFFEKYEGPVPARFTAGLKR